MLKVNPIATATANFQDPKSYVDWKGREVLKGEDWKKRKRELWERCKGKCEYFHGGIAHCFSEAIDAHHVIPRSKGRDDRLENLQALCRFHHEIIDLRKVRWNKKAVDEFMQLTEGM